MEGPAGPVVRHSVQRQGAKLLLRTRDGQVEGRRTSEHSPPFLCSYLLAPNALCQILAALANNSLEVYHLPPPASSKAPAVEPIRLYTLDIPGHRSDVRTLCVSSDDSLLASASSGSLKIWNVKTTKCVRTMECGYAICSTFLPGDRHVRPPPPPPLLLLLCSLACADLATLGNRSSLEPSRARSSSTTSPPPPSSKPSPPTPVPSGACTSVPTTAVS